ncbi:CheY-like receiver domain-containing protein [Solitalea canadensis DSM 3403]|uniref:CheY-like receiver domain-containing protein n=1 Tax=Solitalea canadensis (strain ATCC 29591 / DSM 3403 / JCM 21819 / LMG 8368 / NBRC 15130 / NCIMB 12057 / USAM 9D) TaxID=929556 RepID=H8KNP0_SOLCM|nr:CheY-like receiver domain-containing protein [Solitalea canadensis DSM 3403]
MFFFPNIELRGDNLRITSTKTLNFEWMENFIYNSALIIDDSTIDNLIHKKILVNYHFVKNVHCVVSVKDGLDYLQTQFDKKADLPELIFLDIRMPDMNGFDFLKMFEQLEPAILEKCKIYMLSSSLDPVDHERIANYKFVKKFLGKPLTRQILEEEFSAQSEVDQ